MLEVQPKPSPEPQSASSAASRNNPHASRTILRGCSRDAVLEVGVEELVRDELGRVTGQIEGLDLFTISTATSRSTSGLPASPGTGRDRSSGPLAADRWRT